MGGRSGRAGFSRSKVREPIVGEDPEGEERRLVGVETAAAMLASVEVKIAGGKNSRKVVRISVLRKNLKMPRGVIVF